MEAGLELEDDVFFADLSKQISLLILDDDDDDHDDGSLSHCPSVNPQAFTEAIHPARQASIFVSYDHNQQTSKREISKGTGVFIPRSSHPRSRKNVKQGRFTAASANKFNQRLSDHNNNNNNNSRGLPHNMAYNNNNINPSHDSFNIRRF